MNAAGRKGCDLYSVCCLLLVAFCFAPSKMAALLYGLLLGGLVLVAVLWLGAMVAIHRYFHRMR